jgi:uncharacterized protein (DUF4415 family)
MKSDLKRIDALSEDQIDYSDIPALDEEFLTKAATVWASPKKHVSVRVDEDVLAQAKMGQQSYKKP